MKYWSHERPDEAIRDASTGHDNAMLAVATSHQGMITGLLLGSTAAAVIRNAHVPVLVVPKSGTSPPKVRRPERRPCRRPG